MSNKKPLHSFYKYSKIKRREATCLRDEWGHWPQTYSIENGFGRIISMYLLIIVPMDPFE